MTKGLFALLLAGTLTVPHFTLANEGTVGLGTTGLGARDAQPQTGSWETAPLRAIPHLDATLWATSEFALRGPKVDILLGPKPDTLGPFLVQPSTPPRQSFSKTAPLDY
jgi:hypothetical protein